MTDQLHRIAVHPVAAHSVMARRSAKKGAAFV